MRQIILPEFYQPPGLRARSLGDLMRRIQNDPRELLHFHYLVRGGGLLLVGPTGIGKSSFSMQAMISWALNKAAFDIHPTGPLTSLLIQAENDDGDLADMRDGVIAGLGLSDADRIEAMSRILVHQETNSSGTDFFNSVVRALLIAHEPDLLWIDPALAYLGGESNSQADVGTFLRNNLQPLLREFECGAIIIHHTSKPPAQKNRKKQSALDLAYSGSGSAEWANWARAVLVIEPTGVQNVYNLHAAKRGNHLRWDDGDGSRVLRKTIAHSLRPDEIYWRSATEHEEELIDLPSSVSRADEVLRLIPAAEPIEKKDLEAAIARELGMSRTGKDLINTLLKAGKAYLWYREREGGGRNRVFVWTQPQPEEDRPKTKKKGGS